MVDIQSSTAEIRRGKKKEERRRNRMKIYMVSLLHRATINKLDCKKTRYDIDDNRQQYGIYWV